MCQALPYHGAGGLIHPLKGEVTDDDPAVIQECDGSAVIESPGAFEGIRLITVSVDKVCPGPLTVDFPFPHTSSVHIPAMYRKTAFQGLIRVHTLAKSGENGFSPEVCTSKLRHKADFGYMLGMCAFKAQNSLGY